MIEERLRARGDWLGASCVPRLRDSGMLLAGREEGDRLVLSGIGGKVEPRESFEAAMRREFYEECGCRVGRVFAPAPKCLTAGADDMPVPGGAAALVVERPAEHRGGGALRIAVFTSLLEQFPRPVEKVKIFVAVSPASGWPVLNELRLDDLVVVAGDGTVPAVDALPGVTQINAEHTAAAVLRSPGLLGEWWRALSPAS